MKEGDERPLLAPCRELAWNDPLRWLKRGWADFRASLGLSLSFGVGTLAVSALVVAGAWRYGGYILVLAFMTGFVFIAPLLATALYSVSRQIQRGQAPSAQRALRRMRKALGNAMVFALVLMIIFLIWARAASMVHIFFPTDEAAHWGELALFLGVGSAVGSVFAVISFAIAAFSLPMIVDREVDMITAVVSSVNAVLRNKPAMACWSLCIVALVGLGFATLGIGLIVAVPLLAYATYHGYLETIDADLWEPSDTG